MCGLWHSSAIAFVVSALYAISSTDGSSVGNYLNLTENFDDDVFGDFCHGGNETLFQGPVYHTDLGNRTPIYIQGLFEEDDSRSEWCVQPRGRSELAAARLAIEHVNEKNVIPGFELRMYVNYTKCDLGMAVDAFFHALYTKKQMSMLLGPGNSELAAHLGKITPYWNMIQMSFGSMSPVLSDRKAFPTFYRTVAPESSHNDAKLAFIKQFQWDTVSTISEQGPMFSQPITEMVASAEDANITVKASLTVTEFGYKEQLQTLKDEDARIILASFSESLSRKVFCEVYRLGLYGKDYVWILNGGSETHYWKSTNDSQCSRLQWDRATTGIITANNYVKIDGSRDTISGLTYTDLRMALKKSGRRWSRYVPHTYDAVWALALTMREARTMFLNRQSNFSLEDFSYTNTEMTKMMTNIIESLCFEGVSGPILFHGPDRLGMTAFHQKQDDLVQFALYYPRKELLDFQCRNCKPLSWQGGDVPIARRIFKLRINTINALAFLIVTILSIMGITVAILFLVFNLYFRKLKYIKLSSPQLNNMVVVGCILVYMAVILLGVDFATLSSGEHFSKVCISRAYLLSSGFSLAFGSMFAKTYRVHKIFTRSCIGIVRNKMLKDKQLIAIVSVLLLIDCFLVTLWVSVDPMDRKLWNLTYQISKTERNVAYMDQLEKCTSKHMDKWLGALYVYKGLLLVFGCYMAWETRNVKFQALNDSQYIGLSVYNVVITSIIVVFIANILSSEVTLSFLLVASLILVSTTAALFLLFLPKILTIYRHQDGEPVVTAMGLKIECNTRRFEIDEARELQYRAEVQNRAYKKEILELDQEIIRITCLISELDSPCDGTTAPYPSPATARTTEEIGQRANEDLIRTNVRSKKRLIGKLHKKVSNLKMLQSFDLGDQTPSCDECQTLTMSLPSLDTSVKKSQSSCDELTKDTDVSHEKNFFCDDEWDVDNSDVFHEVIIGEAKNKLTNSDSSCNHVEESHKEMTLVPITDYPAECASLYRPPPCKQEEDRRIQDKKVKVEKLRRELQKIESELKAIEQESQRKNS